MYYVLSQPTPQQPQLQYAAPQPGQPLQFVNHVVSTPAPMYQQHPATHPSAFTPVQSAFTPVVSSAFTPVQSAFAPVHQSAFTTTQSAFTPTQSAFTPTQSAFTPTQSAFAPLPSASWQQNSAQTASYAAPTGFYTTTAPNASTNGMPNTTGNGGVTYSLIGSLPSSGLLDLVIPAAEPAPMPPTEVTTAPATPAARPARQLSFASCRQQKSSRPLDVPSAALGDTEPGPRQLIVNYLSLDIDSTELGELFAPYGEVELARVAVDAATGKSIGYGFVYMRRHADAMRAVEHASGRVLLGKRVRVSFAVPQRSISSSTPFPSAQPTPMSSGNSQAISFSPNTAFTASPAASLQSKDTIDNTFALLPLAH